MLRTPFRGRLLAACASILVISACSSDPNVEKVRSLERGNAFMASGKVAEAIIEFKNAVKLDAKYGEARLQLARALEQRRDPTAAREYVKAADALPDSYDAQFKAASALLQMRQYEEAQKRADKALALKPRSAEAQIVRAFTLAGLKDMNGAFEEMERAAQSEPGNYRAFTNLGALQVIGGKPEEAEAAFKQAVLTNPSAPEPKLALAYFYLMARRFPDTERVLTDLLRADPQNAPANRMLAYGRLAAGRVKEAEAPLRLLADQKDARATLLLGDLYVATGRLTDARPVFEAALAHEAERDAAGSRLATLDYKEGRKTEAYARLEARIGKPQAPTSYWVLKAQFLSLDGRRPEALEAARKAVEMDPKSSDARYWLGIVEEQNGNSPAAIAAHTEALKLEPRSNAPRLALSRLMAAAGRTDEALQHAQDAQKALPQSGEARLAVVRALLQKRELRAAEAQIAPLSQQYPEATRVRAMHGHVLLAKGDLAGAARHFDAALAVDAADADALAGRIRVDLSMKRPNDARARVERALAHRTDARVLTAAARLEATDNKPEAAEKYLRKAMEVEPSNLQTYELLGRLYLKQNRLDEGKRELEHIAQKKKDAVGVRTMIGMIEQIQGKTDDAMKTYEEILKDNSVATIAANNLAYLYADRNQRMDDAVRLAQAAKLQAPESHAISDTLGWVYIKKGLAQAAIAPLEFSVSKEPDNPLYLYHLGLAYAKAGQPEKAQKVLADALRIKPDFDGAQDARQTLASLK